MTEFEKVRGMRADGTMSPDRMGYPDYEGECAGEWIDRAEEIVRANEDMFRPVSDGGKEISMSVHEAASALAEFAATGDPNDADGMLERIGWCAQWHIKQGVNSILETCFQAEPRWPEVEDDYCWWDGMQCEYTWDDPKDKYHYQQCQEICDEANGDGGEYDQKAYCGRHLAWMMSDAYLCDECDKEITEEEFNDSDIDFGDPDSPLCGECRTKRVNQEVPVI